MYLPVSQIRAVDRYAIDVLGIPSLILMENAGKNSSSIILREYPKVEKYLVICGKGNNAGDGFVIARQLIIWGKEVDILLLNKPDSFSPDAKVNYEICRKLNIGLISREDINSLEKYDAFIDAVYGVGFRGDLPENISSLFTSVNAVTASKIAIDIPSGIEADSGKLDKSSFKADVTITMFAKKQAFKSLASTEVTGKVFVVDIGIPNSIVDRIEYDSDIYKCC